VFDCTDDHGVIGNECLVHRSLNLIYAHPVLGRL
jgi:hypothetical protein